MARQVLDNGVILPSEYSDDWYDDMTSNLTKLDEVIGSDAEKLDESDVGAAAISNDYDDLDDKPTYNILRRASVTLTAGGTGNYSDLDSDSKIKAGDYVLDAANKLYSITAIDAANSTYTVSAAALFTVTDKAELGAAALSNSYDDLNNLPGYGILRFCSTAITDNSNVAFANISSVSKIAAGDFLLDTAGKLYQIASVDTANETVSVTTPLTQLALDANVVHNSSNEIINGDKTFSNSVTVKNSNVSGASRSFVSVSRTVEIGDTNNGDSTRFIFLDKNNSEIAFVRLRKLTNSNNDLGLCVNNIDTNNNNISAEINFVLDRNNDARIVPSVSNFISLGRQFSKWKNVWTSQINGLTPSNLSLPENTYIDISGYITDFSGGSNLYRALDNGIVAVDISGTDRYVLFNNDLSIGDRITGTNMRRAAIIQVRKNDTVIIQSNGGTLIHAKFFPCFGNV